MPNSGVLAGIRVIDFGRFIAGLYLFLFRCMGAEGHVEGDTTDVKGIAEAHQVLRVTLDLVF